VRVRVLALTGGYRAYAFNIAWPSEIYTRLCRGSMCNGVGVVVGTMACCIGEFAQGAGFGSPNCKPGCAGSDLICSAQNKAHHVEGVCGVRMVL